MQYPTEVPGVSVVNFLRTAYQAVKGEQVGALAFRKHMKTQMDRLNIEDAMVNRYVNQGFSGGEKKRNEVLQLAVLEPKIAILDETDSGLDIDSLKLVAEGVNELVGPDLGVLLITHYQRMLNYITPDRVHVMMSGRIVKSGGAELAHELEAKGYEGIRSELGLGRRRRRRGWLSSDAGTERGHDRSQGHVGRRGDPPRLPDPVAHGGRASAGLPRQRRHQSEAAAR